MGSLIRKLSKFLFVFLPCAVFIYPAILGMMIRNAYLGLVDRDDLLLRTKDDEFHARAADLAVTSFWTLALSAFITSLYRK